MATVEQGIEQLEGMFEMLLDERNRLGAEVVALDAARFGGCVAFPALCVLDIGELETRASAQMTMIDVIERFVSRLPSMVAVAQEGNATVLNRMLVSTQRVLQAVGATSAIDEVWTDASRLVTDLVNSAIKAATPPSSLLAGLGAALGVALVVVVATR